MDRVKLNENFELSRIVQGMWRANKWNKSPKEVLKFMQECIELGITSFDTADIYMTEELQGNAMNLKKSLRYNIEIITKCGIKLPGRLVDCKVHHYDSSKDHIKFSIESSLKRLQTDYVDLLLIHRPDYLMNPEEMAEAFNELHNEGKVLNFGVSNFTPSQVDMLKTYLDFPIVTNQVEISPVRLEPFIDGTLDNCLKNKMTPMAWSPLAGGKIFNVEDERGRRLMTTLNKIKEKNNIFSIDEVIYAWLLYHPSNIIPIIGSGKIERVKLAVDSLKVKLTREDWYEIWQSSTGKEIY
ncbi:MULTISPECIES: aldo/keto reductase [Clostridium]|uniref:aldo/keto reductase n=1 Tax=Clostridium TaxID=1485 RepID=UPI0013C9DB5B|nr:aldo/keto reductase [Clostridium botulinum]MBY7023598.1 aldo/keto reductase [Clostridium botulinum]NFE74132.1 oxidoreductase [Clostridium botulinum]NFL58910.1 oxidoreductase [Clostridium botulinum]NFL62440.1 oxidoreductase [Clostridium botulinum]NFO66511.1 oxidoreductase [Clostridium botulinum]